MVWSQLTYLLRHEGRQLNLPLNCTLSIGSCKLPTLPKAEKEVNSIINNIITIKMNLNIFLNPPMKFAFLKEALQL